MSDDLVNQITLNYLISKSQLQKLNNKIKQKEQDAMKTDKEIYKEQINELFTKCLNDEFPDDLLQDVRNSFTYFIEKSVYYLKIKANQSNENAEETVISVAESSSAAEEAVASLEEDEDAVISEAESLEEDEEAEEDAVISEAESLEAEEEEEAEEAEILEKTQRVFKKSSKPVHSEGVEDINKLPLDWFTKVKYNQNQIKKLKEKKNITNVYENKKNKK
jgi:hypothetical protein